MLNQIVSHYRILEKLGGGGMGVVGYRGQAKILDFGLVKLQSERGPAAAPASEQTVTAVQTDPGHTASV